MRVLFNVRLFVFLDCILCTPELVFVMLSLLLFMMMIFFNTVLVMLMIVMFFLFLSMLFLTVEHLF